ncbi:MAG: carbohydrate-binding family 9-like protein [Kiritimatiellaeota bacterium]|nr:carbohydrate-binding family 9-like protein [Kiritimatiellota bacterium]
MNKAGWGLLFGSILTVSGCVMMGGRHMESTYVVKRAAERPALDGNWDAPAWRSANILRVDHFMAAPKATDHKPGVQAKVTYADDGLFVFFKVSDHYVVCRNVGFQARVYKDSCAEFFVQPKAGKGYFNFEMNCGGSLLVTYIEDARRTPIGFVKFTEMPPEMDALVPRFHSLPSRIDPEQVGPAEWRLEYFIPFSFFERYVGPLGKVAGQTWRANFLKCADDSSHPHWATWAPLDPDFAGGFHRPDKFGVLRFE